ncbi:YggT family protein [Mariniluteicoccus flavus]
MQLIGAIIDFALLFYMFVLIARMVLSWVPMFSPGWEPRGPMLIVAEAVYSLTDPPLRALRKVIPPVRIGQAMLDVGFMVLWVAILVLRTINRRIFFSS